MGGGAQHDRSVFIYCGIPKAPLRLGSNEIEECHE